MSWNNAFHPLVLSWRLAPGVSLEAQDDEGLVLTAKPGRSIRIPQQSVRLRRALLELCNGAGDEQLFDLAGPEEAPVVYYLIGRLVRLRLVEASADRHGAAVMRLLPRGGDFDLPRATPTARFIVLDRFACLRRVDRGALLQAPEAVCDIIFQQPEFAKVVLCIASGPVEVAKIHDPLDRAMLLLLLALGFVTDAEENERSAKVVWEFHDCLFHRASRSYDDGVERGGTYRFHGALPAPQALRPRYAGLLVELPAPGREKLAGSRSLYEVMEERRSRRTMASNPLDLNDISEMLHRVARVTGFIHGHDTGQDCLRRPFPSGGAIHELEFYLAVRCCEGLAPGFYHYSGSMHALTHLANAEDHAAAMLEDCARAWGQPQQPPQALVVIASRIPRLAWKYAGIAYKTSCVNAGVILQSLYLVTTDMGLAGCAAGSGNPDLFARATGVDPWEETSIAEFGFGRHA